MPEGQGFAGQHGRAGYILILSILVRPLLLVISMFLAMIIMQATGSLLQALFSPFTVSMKTFGAWYNGLGPVGSIFLFILLSGTIAVFTWKIFALITAMPDRIIRWAGSQAFNLGDEGRTATANDVIGSTSGQARKIQNITAGTVGGVKGLKAAYGSTPQAMSKVRKQLRSRTALPGWGWGMWEASQDSVSNSKSPCMEQGLFLLMSKITRGNERRSDYRPIPPYFV